ncbi:RagB/SusD family nutrient uptake outer membrane protein [Olivibacter sitiensis]|uniref:RagB/SusD family nutrient uptake outer membrane protein n=1 Tax=Olivibacter sitiensis TaxID=376470 RepID=UPI00041BE0E5|nr:RagB/SusD family nutrient uptake outer membrane protein [Olivibacter sitiensis]
MKKIIYTCFFAVALLVAACQKDYLERVPLDTINTENYYKTAADAIAAVNGAYQPLQWPKLYNMRMWTTDIWAGNSQVGAGGGTDGIETQDIANFVTTTDNAAALDVWRGPAPGILRCNTVLQRIPDIEMDEELKNRILGEAKFLRAHYYFVLVQLFGDVPLILLPQGPEDDLYPPRTPKAEVYQQIIQDLAEAIGQLPTAQSYGAEDKGRASKGAAAGLLAKVYVTLGQYEQALPYITQVEGMGYSLNANYANNFNPSMKNGVESLFEVQYIGKTSADFWSDANQASWLSTFMGPRNSNMAEGGWGWNQPTSEFVNAYENGDLRKDATIFYEGGPNFDGQAYRASYSSTGYNVRKFIVSRSIAPTYDASPMNFPVLRYADILLLKAEALNELGRTVEAEEPLNQVRSRAGLPAVSGLGQDAFRQKVLHERRMELAFEGHRWFDLVRVGNGQYGLNFLHSIGKLNATQKHLLLPIPQQERDANSNLTQNNGY